MGVLAWTPLRLFKPLLRGLGFQRNCSTCLFVIVVGKKVLQGALSGGGGGGGGDRRRHYVTSRLQ